VCLAGMLALHSWLELDGLMVVWSGMLTRRRHHQPLMLVSLNPYIAHTLSVLMIKGLRQVILVHLFRK
jgi:hypothetical protein